MKLGVRRGGYTGRKREENFLYLNLVKITNGGEVFSFYEVLLNITNLKICLDPEKPLNLRKYTTTLLVLEENVSRLNSQVCIIKKSYH